MSEELNGVELTEETLLLELFEKYPGLQEYMPSINPLFAILNSPVGKMMIKKATIGIACERTGMKSADIIAGIREFIEK